MKIGMVTQWFEPEPAAAAHPTAIARALRRRGHELTVLTGFPNYPSGRLYEGYQMRPRTRERLHDLEVVRVPLIPSHEASAVKRSLALGSFALSASLQYRVLRDVDVCLVYLTPATVGMVARTLRRTAGVPYVLYVQDLWPESVTASGFIGNKRLEGLVEAGIHRFCGGLYARASSVVSICPSMARILGDRGVRPEQSEVIYNWVDESIFRPSAESCVPREPALDPRSAWMMYAGGIGELQGLESAVDALARLPTRPDIKLALVGDGIAVGSLLDRAVRLGVADRVHHLGSRPMREMPALMSQARAQLISLRDLPVFHATVPSKTQSTMACGLPIVCSVPGDAATLVEEARAGFTAPPGDVPGLADAFRRMADADPADRAEMGACARRFYETRLSEAAGSVKLERVLATASSERRP